jgi:predicted DNA-binding transcriptional regulator AlpA
MAKVRSSARTVCKRYDCGLSTLDRWVADKEMGFPKPIVINRIRLWDDAELDEFDRTRAAETEKAAA